MFPPKFKVWPEVLREHGWNVGITGKGWGPGIAQTADGKPRQLIGTGYNKRTAKPATNKMGNNDYAANFVDFLDAVPQDKPWCFWYAVPNRIVDMSSNPVVTKGGKQLSDITHVPSYWPDHETVRHDMLDYAFEVEHTDQHLGHMLAELEKRKLLDNTIIIVTSDHGMPISSLQRLCL